MNYQNRLKKLNSVVNADSSTAVLLNSSINRNYYFGFKSSFGIALCLLNKSFYLTDNRYYEQACIALSYNKDITVVSTSFDNFLNVILDIIEENKIKKIYFEDNRLIYSEFLDIKSFLQAKAELLPLGFLIDSNRIIKSEQEIEFIKKAQQITDNSFSNLLKFIKVGITEKDIKNELHYQMFKLGADDVAFDTIIASGRNSSKPHASVSDKKIEFGDFITLDFGAMVNGYCSDMTRTVAVGKVNSDMVKTYKHVLIAQNLALECLEENQSELAFKKVSEYFDENLLRDNFLHGLGHGLGLEIHEAPYLNSKTVDKIPVNSVVSVEPGLYFNGNYGVRIEDIVVIKENGILNLTKSNKDLIIL